MENKLLQIQQQLTDYSADADVKFTVEYLQNDTELLQITLEDRQELPVYLSISDSQILCILNLFTEEEVADAASMHQAMLAMNISLPLSSFAKLGEQYMLYGALATNSNIDDIAGEIITLSDNSLAAISTMQTYLK